jgi:hypothetical protein
MNVDLGPKRTKTPTSILRIHFGVGGSFDFEDGGCQKAIAATKITPIAAQSIVCHVSRRKWMGKIGLNRMANTPKIQASQQATHAGLCSRTLEIRAASSGKIQRKRRWRQMGLVFLHNQAKRSGKPPHLFELAHVLVRFD